MGEPANVRVFDNNKVCILHLHFHHWDPEHGLGMLQEFCARHALTNGIPGGRHDAGDGRVWSNGMENLAVQLVWEMAKKQGGDQLVGALYIHPTNLEPDGWWNYDIMPPEEFCRSGDLRQLDAGRGLSPVLSLS